MRKMFGKAKAAVVLTVAGGMVVGLAGATSAIATTQVTATVSVNIRSGPSTNTKVIGGLYKGQTVTAVSEAKGWTKIKFAGETAYIASKYLAEGKDLPAPDAINSGTIKIATANLNLRKGPGLSYDVIKTLASGTKITLTGKGARGWAEVSVGTSTGWASTQYLASSNGLPSTVGTRLATVDLDIRTTSGTDAKTVGLAKKGTKLSITGAIQNGRAQIVWNSTVRWVTAKYLDNAAVNQPVAPTLPKTTGTRYATTLLNIRSNNTEKYTLIAEVPRGTELSITGVVTNGRMQIVYKSAVRWVTAQYLATTKPAGGAVAGPPAPGNPAIERNLQPKTVKLYRTIKGRYPQIKTIYGWRRDVTPDHPAGRALDVMIPSYKTSSSRALGSEIAAWGRANHKALNIHYIIWDQKIWNVDRNNEGWRPMAGRGGDTANHKDHVHFTLYDG